MLAITDARDGPESLLSTWNLKPVFAPTGYRAIDMPKPQRAAMAVNALKWRRLRAIRNYLSSTVLSKVESVDESVDRKST
jgi:hypothetical protein